MRGTHYALLGGEKGREEHTLNRMPFFLAEEVLGLPSPSLLGRPISTGESSLGMSHAVLVSNDTEQGADQRLSSTRQVLIRHNSSTGSSDPGSDLRLTLFPHIKKKYQI